MKGFDYYRSSDRQRGCLPPRATRGQGFTIAGGSDMLAMMKDRVEGPKLKSPVHLIDIKGIDGLADIRQEKDVLRIGAAATLTVSRNRLLSGTGCLCSPRLRSVWPSRR